MFEAFEHLNFGFVSDLDVRISNSLTPLKSLADRAYEVDGSLRPRRLPGAVLHDASQAAAQAVRIARDGLVVAYSGQEIPVQAETLCIHGDTPTALTIAGAIRQALVEAGVEVAPLASREAD